MIEPIIIMMMKSIAPIVPTQKNLEENIVGVCLIAVALALVEISLRYSCLSILV